MGYSERETGCSVRSCYPGVRYNVGFWRHGTVLELFIFTLKNIFSIFVGVFFSQLFFYYNDVQELIYTL